ncbi:hypothetical protein IAI10_16210 [Clostridium sp. 19966]|uniref:hypothetical protein n=1 Tax=Clostridium sp. 19966 TaxID=2768166 RepID=UPI0028DE5B2D|nr:hypothetical protein [Clostridium sp. 19966]MDT8718211.1 hypothetical protein [Clostridium sp. 19966]
MGEKLIAKRDLCEDIKKGDEIESVPIYSYMIGENTRIKDYFHVKADEIVVKKVQTNKGKEELSFIKCKRTDIENYAAALNENISK